MKNITRTYQKPDIGRELVTSDQHFGHDNIIKYCDRPQNHHDVMIDGWNEIVKDVDVVYHLGDYSLTNRDDTKMISDILNGTRHLVKGNHDRHSNEWYYDMGFESVGRENIILVRSGITIVLSHRPVPTEEIMDYRQPYTTKVINIHGHVHNNGYEQENDNRYINVSVEETDYKPVYLDDIIAKYK